MRWGEITGGAFEDVTFLTFPHRVQLNVAGYEFFGQADLPQTAKHNAASQVRSYLKKLKTTFIVYILHL